MECRWYACLISLKLGRWVLLTWNLELENEQNEQNQVLQAGIGRTESDSSAEQYFLAGKNRRRINPQTPRIPDRYPSDRSPQSGVPIILNFLNLLHCTMHLLTVIFVCVYLSIHSPSPHQTQSVPQTLSLIRRLAHFAIEIGAFPALLHYGAKRMSRFYSLKTSTALIE